jgi:hypothetical protein
MGITEQTALAASVWSDILANATGELLRTGAITLYGIEIDNTANTSAVYAKVYDKATAAATEADDPTWIFPCPASSKLACSINGAAGQALTLGLSVRCVTAAGTAGTNSPTNPVKVKVATS